MASNLNNVAYVAAQMGRRPTTYASLLAPFDQLEFMPTTSLSATVILSGVMRVKPSVRVFLKIFPERKSDDGDTTFPLDNLLCESDIYNELFKLREMHITPNILARVDTYTLLAADKFLDEPIFDTVRFGPGRGPPGGPGGPGQGKAEYLARRQQELAKYVAQVPLEHQWELQPDQWTTTRCILTRSIEASLNNVLKHSKLPYEEVVPILYQIMHTLCIFEHFQISHHDLHLSNIRVEEHAAPIDLYYRHGDKHVRVHTKFVVKLFDFDRSSIYKTTPLLDSGGSGGVLLQAVRSRDPINKFKFQTFNPKEDAFKVLHHILQMDGLDADKRQQLLNFVVPGHNSQETLLESYKRLSVREQHWVEKIVEPYLGKLAEEGKKIEKSSLNKSYKNYFQTIEPSYHALSMPPGKMSKYSVYLPDYIMRPNAAILTHLLQDQSPHVTVLPFPPPPPIIEYGLHHVAVATSRKRKGNSNNNNQTTPKRMRMSARQTSENQILIDVIHNHVPPLSVTEKIKIIAALKSILVKFDHENKLHPLFVKTLMRPGSNNEVVLGIIVGMLAAFDSEEPEPSVNNILPMFPYFKLTATPATLQEGEAEAEANAEKEEEKVNINARTKGQLILRIVKNISTNTDLSDRDISQLYSVFKNAHIHGVFNTFQKINPIHCGLLILLLVVVTVEQTRAYNIFTNYVGGALTNLL